MYSIDSFSFGITVNSILGVSHFPLMAHRENQHGIVLCLKAIQGNVASPATGDNQFTFIQLDMVAKQGVTLQYRDGFPNQLNGFHRRQWICLQQEIRQPFKVL